MARKKKTSKTFKIYFSILIASLTILTILGLTIKINSKLLYFNKWFNLIDNIFIILIIINLFYKWKIKDIYFKISAIYILLLAGLQSGLMAFKRNGNNWYLELESFISIILLFLSFYLYFKKFKGKINFWLYAIISDFVGGLLPSLITLLLSKIIGFNYEIKYLWNALIETVSVALIIMFAKTSWNLFKAFSKI